MSGFLWPIVSVFFAYLSSKTIQRLYHVFQTHGWQRANYEQRTIVHGLGISFLLLLTVYGLIYYALVTKLTNPLEAKDAVIFFLLVSVLTFIGWLDDRYGETAPRGFKGHLTAYFKQGRVTTGLFKALVGLIVSVTVSLLYCTGVMTFVLYTLLLLSSIHFFNLLDVRPGRSIKSFWLLALTLFPFQPAPVFKHIIVPVLIISTCLFLYDRKRVAMIGDTGSNVLGGIFGYLLLLSTQQVLQLLFLLLFLCLSVLAERYSLSQLIKKNPLLSKFDNWGIL